MVPQQIVVGYSWKDYIAALLEKGHASKAAIHSCGEGKLWAGCLAFDISREEVLEIVDGFSDSSILRQYGININGKRYTLTRISEGKIMVGRDVFNGSGCVIYKCNTCVIICVHDENMSLGGCYSVVERIGDFLCNKSF
ncbi:hypothetical protein LOTGIDRAFT_112056 [Lottia gigantea]|uniref:Profilin n=1 Tax=Lottia gigantea TaxID=225164 RepID=V4AZZ1_LOTGI|nr:hypothetical protein LOTGIDRAFT_112056 [Lottia gigantea]ESP00736.1 hypothetical protein LOTGIDRAFT_112056 [Lottia gigantea]